MEERTLKELVELIASKRAVLFTGAGFSTAAPAQDGRPIPSSEELCHELWELCFPNERSDESALSDLFHHAAHHKASQLEALCARRLRCAPDRLPRFFGAWLGAPWLRVWTLNVDDVDEVVNERLRPPRPLRALSALTTPYDEAHLARRGELTVVHLNGRIAEGIHQVTFSPPQYGHRLSRVDPWYERFTQDLLELPFVAVGTRFDEAPLWRHLQAQCPGRTPSPPKVSRAYIVSPELSRARRALLEDLGMRWVPSSAREFADQVLVHVAQRPPP